MQRRGPRSERGENAVIGMNLFKVRGTADTNKACFKNRLSASGSLTEIAFAGNTRINKVKG
mgnify:CR=1 FL=1